MTQLVNGKVILGIPVLDKPELDFMNCFIQCVLAEIFVKFCTIQATLLPFARNDIVRKVFINDPDFTHIMFIDADMCNFFPEHIIKLFEADKDIISGVCVMRSPPHKIVNSLPEGTDISKGEIVEVIHSGMAFTLIKREVFEKCREDTPVGPIWFTTDRDSRDSFDVEADEFIKYKVEEINTLSQNVTYKTDIKQVLLEAIALGRYSHIGTQLVGEDIAFCHKAIQLGFKCWTHCGVIIGHRGSKIVGLEDAEIKPDLKIVKG